jgi:hypothetical protein
VGLDPAIAGAGGGSAVERGELAKLSACMPHVP